MNLEQIVKETVAKIVAEKHLTAAEKKKKEDIVMAMKKDFKGPKAVMYAIATDKAKKLAEETPRTTDDGFKSVNDQARKHEKLMNIANSLFPEFGGKLDNFNPLSKDQRDQVYSKFSSSNKLEETANKIYITHKGPSDDPNSNYMQYDLTFNGDEINAEEYAKGWKVIRYDDWEDEWKDVRNPKKQEIINFINAYNEKNSDNVNEGNLNKDHEVSMAQRSLDSIIRAAMELKAKIGDQEIDIPAWIQDHITNSENYIDQASQGYHEYHNGAEEINEEFDFVRSAIESASGDKLKPGNDYDDYDRPIYFSANDDYTSYFIGIGGEYEGEIYKYNAKTGKHTIIGDLSHYSGGQNHTADDDMHESQQELDEFIVRRWQYYAGIK